MLFLNEVLVADSWAAPWLSTSSCISLPTSDPQHLVGYYALNTLRTALLTLTWAPCGSTARSSLAPYTDTRVFA
jgi:hypothetical protein